MLASLLLTFREGLEAALIVGIILGYLGQIGHPEGRRPVWLAVGAAAGISLALAISLQILGQSLEGTAEQIFEGIAMLLAVIVLTWMIFWMRYQARQIKPTLEADVQLAVRERHSWALFSLSFLAVFREGVETALFLTATSFVSDGLSTLVGGLIGLGLAVIAGWLIYSSTARLNVRRFFDVTSVLLLVFAAGLFAHGIHEFQEAGWLPIFVDELWSTRPLLSDGSTVGATLRVLVGYNDNPTLLEVVSYLGYWLILLVTINRWVNRRPLSTPAASSA